ncbi:sushi, von Willebrand factor type A, EGF and pentraxin domain-containing protein 1-like [Sycon ciliatum]|uniref:sushi, von Willebrand factor type A, EGF and pentraxin domain-containing protein 1-like n=1 Tax=Sycon ciliatum TaxID=27933 RepID=UPI0031F6A3D2
MEQIRRFFTILFALSATWVEINAQLHMYVAHFNCNDPQGLYYISNSIWKGTPARDALGRCARLQYVALLASEANSTCFRNYLAHINSALGTNNSAYTNLNGQVSCYPKADPCPTSGPVVVCRSTRSEASNASINSRCPENLQITNGKVVYPSGNVFPSQAFYKCNPGYYNDGFGTADCDGGGAWNGGAFKHCTAYNCPAPKLTDGIITGTSPLYTASCNKGYTLSGSNNVTCVDSATTTCLPACIPITCPATPSITNGYLITTIASFTSGGTANVSCFQGYQRMGPGTITCDSNGQWLTGTSLQHCKLRSCTKLNPPTNGSIVSSSTSPYGMTIFECNNGYELTGNRASVCLASGTWSNTVPTCTKLRTTASLTTTNIVAACIGFFAGLLVPGCLIIVGLVRHQRMSTSKTVAETNNTLPTDVIGNHMTKSEAYEMTPASNLATQDPQYKSLGHV